MQLHHFRLPVLLLFLVAASSGCLFGSGDDSPADDSTPTLPVVTQFSPQQGEAQVDLDTAIHVTFSLPMDPASVASASTLTGDERGLVPYEIVWLGNMATFAPTADLEHNHSYTLSIGVGAVSLEGAALAEPFELSFTTETTWPVVEVTLPNHGAVSVPLNVVCRVEFTQWMDELSTLSAFSISPEVLHAVELMDDDVLQVSFPEGLAAGTLYTLSVDETAESQWGEAMPEPFSFSFTTGNAVDDTPPTIVHMNPDNGDTGVSTSLGEITIEFSEPIDMESFSPTLMDARLMMAVMNYQPDSEPDISWEGNTMRIPVAHLPAGVELFVDFGPFKDLAGNTSADPEAWIFSTAGEPEWFPSGASDWWMQHRYGQDDWGDWDKPALARVENVSGNEFDMNHYTVAYDERSGPPGGGWDPADFVMLDEAQYFSRGASAIRLHGFGHEGEGDLWVQELFDSPVDWLQLPPDLGHGWSGQVELTVEGMPGRVIYGGEVLAVEDVPWSDPGGEGGEMDAVFADCAKVELSYQMQVQLLGQWQTLDEGSNTAWYCAGVGVVKEHDQGSEYSEPGGEPGQHESHMELMLWYVAP